nr:MAG TPA: hypothetical protein [Caudoviricetes sp.]
MWGKHIYSSFSMIFEFFIENSLFHNLIQK